MASEIPPIDSHDAADLSAIDAALAQARTELAAMTDAASAADTLADDSAPEYSLHEVAGVGRYACVRRTGWRALLHVIHDPAANIDFSANKYPGFDGVLGKAFRSPYLLDPLHEKYASYHNLRDNIAAVRNFLMEEYYVHTPNGMTPEKAEKALEEIARYLGEGLDNNYRLFGVIPNFNPSKPHISIIEASMPAGSGAQYLYEKILQMHRQSSWMRPFSAVVALFGGKPAPDWMLPPAYKTEFTNFFGNDIVHRNPNAPTEKQLIAGIKTVESLEASRAALIDRHHVSNTAIDLDAMGNYLLYSATNMKEVGQLSEPVRRDAIDIAKDILRKLKVTLGDINIKDGLKLKPTDDIATLGAVKGVAMVYEKLLAYGRGLDPTIMQQPVVMSATRAIGQLGYLAKMEALRMARTAGDTRLAETISGQLARIPAVYATTSEANFGSLLDKVERGIDFLRSRSQTISGPGAHVGFSASKELGGISAAPSAGMAQQLSLAQNAINQQRAQHAAIAAQQAQTQQADRAQTKAVLPAARVEAKPTQQGQPSRSGSSVRLPGQQAKPAQRATPSSTNTTAPINPNNQQQRTQQQMRMSMQHHHEEEEHEHLLRMQRIQQQQQQLEAQKAARKSAVKTAVKAEQQKVAVKNAIASEMKKIQIDPNLLKSFKSATDTKGLVGDPVNPGGIKNFTQQVTREQDKKTAPAAPGIDDPNKHPPVIPHRPGGRGF